MEHDKYLIITEVSEMCLFSKTLLFLFIIIILLIIFIIIFCHKTYCFVTGVTTY